MGCQVQYHEIKACTERDAALELRTLNGREHLVVPAIILNEGVMHASNAEQPALVLAEEFGVFPQGWDGRPVVYNHPKVNGRAASANSPDVWENGVIGHLFGSSTVNKKLRTFMWLDTAKTPAEVLQTLNDGKSIEVSTGLYTLEEQAPGTFEGKAYDMIWRNIVPDHLAVLSAGTIGACSNQDGCGAPRLNQAQQQAQQQAQHKESTMPKVASGLVASFKKAFDSYLEAFGFKVSEISDNDKRSALDKALATEQGDTTAYVVAVFNDKVIYMLLDPEKWTWSMLQRSYSVADGGAISLSAEVQEVRPETKYVPLVVTVGAASPEVSTSPTSPTSPTSTLTSDSEGATMPDPQGSAASTSTSTTPCTPCASSAPKASSLQELLALANDDVKAQLEGIIQTNNARKESLVRALENKIGLSKAELEVIGVTALEKMAQKVAPREAVDYSAAAGGAPTANAIVEIQGDKVEFTPPTPVFSLKQPKAA